MKKTLVSSLAALFVASAATAYSLGDVTLEDPEGTGLFTLEQLLVAVPDLTEELFGEIDADGDGFASVEELDAAREAGLIADS
jgi:hypothetical protein